MLVVAVIISGGEVDLSKGKFKVHSLGDGLKKLRDLFAGSAPRGPKKAALQASEAMIKRLVIMRPQ